MEQTQLQKFKSALTDSETEKEHIKEEAKNKLIFLCIVKSSLF